MSEWNRGGRNDEMRRRQFEARNRDRDWEDRGLRDGDREPRSFYGADDAQGGTGQGYGYGPRQNQGVSGYAQSGQGYGGQSYGQGYGGAGHSGQSYGSGESHGQSGQSFGQQPYGERSFGGQSYGGARRGGSYGGQGGYGQGSYGGGEARQFGDPNDLVRRVSDGDTGPHGAAGLFGGMGLHRGRGPKNYTRSDERIREDVNDRLADDSWLDASEIEVQVSSCEVTLTGTVTRREDRRRAEDLAEQVSGVKHVQNNLRVQPEGSTTSSYSIEGTSPAGGPSEHGLAGQNSVSGVTSGSTSGSTGGSTGGKTN